jgi:rod shape-determining protein MreC
MVGIPSRHRSLFLLGGVVLLQVLLLAVQIKRDSQGRLIRVWTVGAVSPFERAGAHGISHIRDTWNHYFALQNTWRDNEELKRENGALKLQITQLQSKAGEADRLAALLKFRQTNVDVPMVSARVIGGSADSSQTVYLDRGERDGILRNMGVITPDGVVGKVIETYRDTAQVLLLTDKAGGVGAMLVDSRVQKPVGGTGEPLLVMKYISNEDNSVNLGDRIVTSGMDRIFPRDLPVGTIADIKAGGTFKQIRVRPAANLERLEEVFVLLTMKQLEMKKDSAEPNSATPPAGGPSAAAASPASHEKP